VWKISHDAWRRTPVSFPEWFAMPMVEAISMTLPWDIERAGVVSGFVLNIGGRDPIVDGAPWYLTAQCPWVLSGGGKNVSWDDDDLGDDIVAAVVGRQIVQVGALSEDGDEPTFTLSDGFRLVLSPFSDPFPGPDPYWIRVWGTTWSYERKVS